jgi:hypothetical protein
MVLASSCPVGYGNADLLMLFHCYACCCYLSANFLYFISLMYYFLIINNIIKGASQQICQGEEVLGRSGRSLQGVKSQIKQG